MKRTHTKKPSKFRSLLPWIIVGCVIAAIAVGVGIYTALQEEWATEWLDYNAKDGSYTDPQRGITYLPAPFCYEAVSQAGADFPYARSDKYKNQDEYRKLYQIGYRDSQNKVHLRPGTEWLSTAKEIGGQVYYNPAAVKCPTYAEFDWKQIYFSNPGNQSFSTYVMSEQDTDRLMRDILAKDKENLYDSGILDSGELDAKLTLRVTSNTYHWLYLNLSVYADEEGNYYISPEGVKILDDPFVVAVSADYFADYLKTLEDLVGSGK